MKKIGFTLVEILITLGIVGVIAAITIPSIINTGRGDALGAALAVTASELEQTFTAAISEQKVSDIFSTSIWTGLDPRTVTNKNDDGEDVVESAELQIDSDAADDNISKFVEQMRRYITIRRFSKNAGDAYGITNDKENFPCGYNGLNYNGTIQHPYKPTSCSADLYKYVALRLKNGAFVMIVTNQEAANNKIVNGQRQGVIPEELASEYGMSLRARAGDVIIDVNGADPPNAMGRDMFRYVIGQNGILYPYGGYDVSLIDIILKKNVYPEDNADLKIEAKTWTDSASEYPCNDTSSKDDGTPIPANRSWGCTARLIDNGYKFDY